MLLVTPGFFNPENTCIIDSLKVWRWARANVQCFIFSTFWYIFDRTCLSTTFPIKMGVPFLFLKTIKLQKKFHEFVSKYRIIFINSHFVQKIASRFVFFPKCVRDCFDLPTYYLPTYRGSGPDARAPNFYLFRAFPISLSLTHPSHLFHCVFIPLLRCFVLVVVVVLRAFSDDMHFVVEFRWTEAQKYTWQCLHDRRGDHSMKLRKLTAGGIW